MAERATPPLTAADLARAPDHLSTGQTTTHGDSRRWPINRQPTSYGDSHRWPINQQPTSYGDSRRWPYDQTGSRNPDAPPIGQDEWPALGPNATTGQIMDHIADNYPGMIGFFNSNAEIRNKLIQAAKEGWSPGKLQAEVQSTAWYRSTSTAARDFELLSAQDPAQAQAQVVAVSADIRNKAQSLGLGFSAKQIADMSLQVTRNGWTDQQTIDALLSGMSWDTVQGGTLTATVDDVKAIAGDYLVGVSESTARNYSARIASGELTLEGVRSIMQSQAKGRFGWMGSQIDQGITPDAYFAPVRDVIAGTLEVAPESIDLMDPKWLSLVETRDPNSGEMRAATLNEAMLKARNTSGWSATGQAQDMTAGALQLVQEAMGF